MNKLSRTAMTAVLCAVLCSEWSQSAWGWVDAIVASDVLRLRSVQGMDVSRDGRFVVVAVQSTGRDYEREFREAQDVHDRRREPRWKYLSHLYILDLVDERTAARQLTFGDRRDGTPKFSPDGKWIAFVRSGEAEHAGIMPTAGGKDGPGQLWVMAADGGEARQVTRREEGVNELEWSPDGTLLAFTSSVKINEMEGFPSWSMERPGRTWKDADLKAGLSPCPDGTRAEIRTWLEANAVSGDPVVINRLVFQNERALKKEMAFAQIFLIEPLKEGVAPRQLTRVFADCSDLAFMPDGDSVLYTAKAGVGQHIDRDLVTELWRVNVDDGSVRSVLKVEGHRIRRAKPSRDGTVIGFVGEQVDEPAYRQSKLGMTSVAGNDSAVGSAQNVVWLTEEAVFKNSVDEFDWQPTNVGLLFAAESEGGRPILGISPSAVKPTDVVASTVENGLWVQSFDVGGGTLVYSAGTVSEPCVLRINDGRGDRLLWDLNEWVQEKLISKPTCGWLIRADGLKVQYWLMQPTAMEQGERYPLVLEIHGGPMTMWGPGEITMWHEFQLLCSWGYGVVYCNPRGSSGYGYEFQKKNYQNWGDGPGGDVLAAVDHAMLNEWVDPEKLVVTGGSYGGYLTAWVIAQDRRFKAAVAQRGVYDLNTFFGEGNAWQLVEWCMGGKPYDARFKSVIDRNNPMNFVTRIQTPLLILHSDDDLRTGVSQSEMLYRALKELGKDVEYVRYPHEGHELSRSGDMTRRMDRLNRIVEFFERYVGGVRPEPNGGGSAWRENQLN